MLVGRLIFAIIVTVNNNFYATGIGIGGKVCTVAGIFAEAVAGVQVKVTALQIEVKTAALNIEHGFIGQTPEGNRLVVIPVSAQTNDHLRATDDLHGSNAPVHIGQVLIVSAVVIIIAGSLLQVDLQNTAFDTVNLTVDHPVMLISVRVFFTFRLIAMVHIHGNDAVVGTGTVCLQIPVRNRTVIIVKGYDRSVGIGDLDFKDLTVVHGDGQLLDTGKGHQRNQIPVPLQLFDLDQFRIAERHIGHILCVQRHLQLLKQLRQLDALHTVDGELSTVILKVHGEAGEGREAGSLESDLAVFGDFCFDGAGYTVIVHMDHIDLGIPMQLLAGQLQFHLNTEIRLPIFTFDILHRDIIGEKLGVALAALSNIFIDDFFDLIGCFRNGQRAILRNALDFDGGAVSRLLGSRAGGSGQQLLKGNQLQREVLTQILLHEGLLLMVIAHPLFIQLRFRSCVTKLDVRCLDLADAGMILSGRQVSALTQIHHHRGGGCCGGRRHLAGRGKLIKSIILHFLRNILAVDDHSTICTLRDANIIQNIR